ncbi:hypothetical protein [Corynebacterium gerontici]|uniref:FCS-type domain-containing protein n=1 Tax=Corynebacterium gerontici TaxID=2079234 RepID=A0A3G6J040_9CORY|nr:hypothetical protein [Corynebacterium gerontici]AZA11401.1 hypothetical protein CGERO_05465 [Corynebacterium gerontici]
MSVHNESTCAWCSKIMSATGRGRRRKYCSQACRQRAYEQRSGRQGQRLPVDAVVLSQAKVATLKDALFELRCAAEDVATAVEEQADAEELQLLSKELVELAKRIEQMR